MLLTQSSTDRTGGRHSTQKLCRVKFRNRVDWEGRGLYFPGGGFRLLWGRSPRGLCLCHTAISHCDAGIQRERKGERKRDYWSTAAKNDSNTRGDEKQSASFVPNSFLGDKISLFLFASLGLWIDRERQSGSSMAVFSKIFHYWLAEACWPLTRIKGATACNSRALGFDAYCSCTGSFTFAGKHECSIYCWVANSEFFGENNSATS